MSGRSKDRVAHRSDILRDLPLSGHTKTASQNAKLIADVCLPTSESRWKRDNYDQIVIRLPIARSLVSIQPSQRHIAPGDPAEKNYKSGTRATEIFLPPHGGGCNVVATWRAFIGFVVPFSTSPQTSKATRGQCSAVLVSAGTSLTKIVCLAVQPLQMQPQCNFSGSMPPQGLDRTFIKCLLVGRLQRWRDASTARQNEISDPFQQTLFNKLRVATPQFPRSIYPVMIDRVAAVRQPGAEQMLFYGSQSDWIPYAAKAKKGAAKALNAASIESMRRWVTIHRYANLTDV